MDQFSTLNIPTLDSPIHLEGLPLPELSKRSAERDVAMGKYNRLFRDYVIKYSHFKSIAILFSVLVFALVLIGGLQITFLGEFLLSYRLRAVLIIGLWLILILVAKYLKPHVAPSPGEVVSIDYIGQHFASLHYESVLGLTAPTVYFRDLGQRDQTFKFHLRMRVWVSGFKYLFAVTDPEQQRAYFVSYGLVGRGTDVLHLLDPNSELFAVPLGNLDYAQIPNPKPELLMHLWMLAPLPTSWKSLGSQNPSVLHDSVVVTSPDGGMGFAPDSTSLSFRNVDRSVSFTRNPTFWGGRQWKVSTTANTDPILRTFAKKLAHSKAMETISDSHGRRIDMKNIASR